MTDTYLIRKFLLLSGFGGLLLLLSLVCLFVSCVGDNEYESKSIYDDVDMKFVISSVNDTLTAYCYHQIDFKIIVSDTMLGNIDSILLRTSDVERFERFGETLQKQFSYNTAGEHRVTVRTFLLKDGGKYMDTSFVLKTAFYRLDVPFSLTPERGSDRLNAYCFYPLTFKAEPYRWDMDYIDSLLLYVDDNSNRSTKLTSENGFTHVFEYADTGWHTVRLRRYQSRLVDNTSFRDTSITVNIGVNFRGEAVDVMMEDNGSNITLKAVGDKNTGVLWYWSLHNLLGASAGVRVNGDTSIFVNRVFDGSVQLSQVKGDLSTVSVSVPIRTYFHVNRDVPFTISPARGTNGYNANVFMPVTFTAQPSAVDKIHIDSILVFPNKDNSRLWHRLDSLNNWTVQFNYADTGLHVIRMRIYDSKRYGSPYYRDYEDNVRIGADFELRSSNLFVDDTGGVIVLYAEGSKGSRVLWNWDLSDFRLGVMEKKGVVEDSVSLVSSSGLNDVNRIVYLWQSVFDSVGGRVSERVSLKKRFDVNIGLKEYSITINDPEKVLLYSTPASGSKYQSGNFGELVLRTKSPDLDSNYARQTWYSGINFSVDVPVDYRMMSVCLDDPVDWVVGCLSHEYEYYVKPRVPIRENVIVNLKKVGNGLN